MLFGCCSIRGAACDLWAPDDPDSTSPTGGEALPKPRAATATGGDDGAGGRRRRGTRGERRGRGRKLVERGRGARARARVQVSGSKQPHPRPRRVRRHSRGGTIEGPGLTTQNEPGGCSPATDPIKEGCIETYEKCVNENWAGPCAQCLFKCIAQREWDKSLCYPRSDLSERRKLCAGRMTMGDTTEPDMYDDREQARDLLRVSQEDGPLDSAEYREVLLRVGPMVGIAREECETVLAAAQGAAVLVQRVRRRIEEANESVSTAALSWGRGIWRDRAGARKRSGCFKSSLNRRRFTSSGTLGQCELGRLKRT